MKRFKRVTLAVLALQLFIPWAFGQAIIDDSDLSPGRYSPQQRLRLLQEGRLEGKSLVFPLQQRGGSPLLKPAPETAPEPQAAPSISGVFLLADRQGLDRPARWASVLLIGGRGMVAAAQPDSSGGWKIQPDAKLSGEHTLRFRLQNPYWTLTNPDEDATYECEGPKVTLPLSAPFDTGTLRPDPGTENSKVGWIHLTYVEVLDFFARHGVSLGWWNETLTVNWPASGDFFSPGGWSVHLTTPYAWDVNLHELGHAVMHKGMRIRPAGGQHYIDRCYTPALAWSEGYSTFFAGAVRLDLGDPDARFEYLVPRRAPIRIENVPEDVCKGATNEWRVAAAMWDLLDLHPDGGDRLALPFSHVWRRLEKQYMGSLLDAWALLKEGLTPEQARAGEESLVHNTIELKPRDGSGFKPFAFVWMESDWDQRKIGTVPTGKPAGF